MHYSLGCVSDTGPIRQHNEDNYVFFGNVMPAEHQASDVLAARVSSGQSFAVAVFDGMGGEANGEYASFVAARCFEVISHQSTWSHKAIVDAFALMEVAVCEEQRQKRSQNMGTTATLLAVDDSRAFIGNVGDSPAMIYTNGGLATLSREHTDAEVMRLLGIVGRKPRLTQFLGMSDGEVSPSPHIAEIEIIPDSIILLASDGLTEKLGVEAICEALETKGEVSEKAQLLVNMAQQAGGTDNITVLLCEIAESAPAGLDVIE